MNLAKGIQTESSFNMKLPANVLTPADITTLENAGQLILSALKHKEQPSTLRLMLVEVQAARFEVGRMRNIYKGYARDLMGSKYRANKDTGMSSNAAYKEAEMDAEVIKYKNTSELFETAYEVMESFVTTNQTSLRLAGEEAKSTM